MTLVDEVVDVFSTSIGGQSHCRLMKTVQLCPNSLMEEEKYPNRWWRNTALVRRHSSHEVCLLTNFPIPPSKVKDFISSLRIHYLKKKYNTIQCEVKLWCIYDGNDPDSKVGDVAVMEHVGQALARVRTGQWRGWLKWWDYKNGGSAHQACVWSLSIYANGPFEYNSGEK